MEKKKSRRLFVLTASIGTGHSQAARAIAEAIKEEHPQDSVRVLDFVSRDFFSIDSMIKKSYLKMIELFPEFYDGLYSNSQKSRFGETSQMLVSWSFKNRMKKLIKVLNPDALIFTHPFPAAAANLLKKENQINIPLLGVITDFDIHQLWVDKELDSFCVATEELSKQLVKYGISSDAIYSTGIPIRKSFYEVSKNIKFEKGTVLLMGGGLGLGDIADSLERLDKLSEIKKFIVITGKNINLYEDVAILSEHLVHPVELHSYTNKVAEIMKRSEILVTKPGALSCTEAMILNLPMVLVNTLPGQERANASYMVDKGCALWVKRGELTQAVKSILTNPEKRNKMAESCGINKTQSAKEVVKVLYKLIENNERNI